MRESIEKRVGKELPGIHMQGCCTAATVRAAHAIWAGTVTGTEAEARVNLPLDRSQLDTETLP